MAAPAILNQFSYAFRDAKGQVATMRVRIGGATEAAVTASAATLKGHLAAVTNASVRSVQEDPPVVVYGTAATYQDVEDKVEMVWQQPSTGAIHRYKIPAPLTAIFLADGETPNPGNAAYAAVITDFGTFVYGTILDTGPLQYLGGIRTRSRFQRRANLLTKDPTLTNPEE
jgi:hypothetical protein